MINIVTEGAVEPKFLTANDVQELRYDIPVKDAKIDELMVELSGKMGIDEKVEWANVEDVVQADAAAGISGVANVESFADSRSQQGAPSIWIVKTLLSQTKASPSTKINGKPLTSDVTFTPADFNIYDAATIRAKFATLPTPSTTMKLGTEQELVANPDEIGDGNVLVDVYFDSDKGWVGVFRPLIAVLQDGTEQTVAFS